MAVNDSQNNEVGSLVNQADSGCQFKFNDDIGLEAIRELQHAFISERNWHKFHTPRNVLLALVGEVGELAELFQWKGEVAEGVPDWNHDEKANLRHELSDVLIYLVRLAQLCHVDLPSAVAEKIEHNRKKYPKDKVYGSSRKYTDYAE